VANPHAGMEKTEGKDEVVEIEEKKGVVASEEMPTVRRDAVERIDFATANISFFCGEKESISWEYF